MTGEDNMNHVLDRIGPHKRQWPVIMLDIPLAPVCRDGILQAEVGHHQHLRSIVQDILDVEGIKGL